VMSLTPLKFGKKKIMAESLWNFSFHYPGDFSGTGIINTADYFRGVNGTAEMAMTIILKFPQCHWHRGFSAVSLTATISAVSFLEVGNLFAVLWIRIRIRKDPKLFVRSGSVTLGYGSESETGLESYNHKKIAIW
jgi:hypothetical protein